MTERSDVRARGDHGRDPAGERRAADPRRDAAPAVGQEPARRGRPAGAEVLTELDTWWRLTLAFASFCAASSAIYVLNDLADIEADRRHPTKCAQPLAAGLISVATGWVMAVVLGVVAFALAIATTEWDFVAVLALYVVTTIAYSFWLKHVAILDLVIVASGFLLRHRRRGRRERGGVELVPHRHRLRLAVRRHRQAPRRAGGAGGGGAQRPSDPRPLHRPVPALRHGRGLRGHRRRYCIFSFDKAELGGPGAVWFQLSAIPVVTGLLRCALAVEVGEGATPEDLFLRDRLLQLMGIIWVVLFGVGLIRA